MTRTLSRRRPRLAVTLSLLLALVLAACGDGDTAEDTTTTAAAEDPGTTVETTDTTVSEATTTTGAAEEPAELTEVTLVVPNSACFTYVPLYVAIHRGFYEAEGLDVQVEAVDGSSATVQAIAAGNAEFGIPSPVLVMAAIEQGQNMTTFYNVKPGGSFGVIVQADSGIESPADLEGKVIGISTADGSEVPFAAAVASSAGLVEGEDYEFLVVGDGGPAVAGFTRGDIDAYASAYSDTAVITQAGLEVVDITPDEVRAFFFGNGFTALTETIEEHPEWAEGLARGMAAASVYTWENPEEALDVCAEVNPPEVEDREFAALLLQEFQAPFTPIGDDPWGYFDPASWETLMQQAIDTGSLEGPVDLEIAFTNQFVESTQP